MASVNLSSSGPDVTCCTFAGSFGFIERVLDKIHYWKAKYFLGHLEYVTLWQNVGSNSKRWRVTLSLWMRVGTVSPGPFFSILASEDGFKVPGA